MLIYLPIVASFLSLMMLALVYAADHYEREPIERLQSWFLLGVLVQLILILTCDAIVGIDLWSGRWILLSVGVAALVLPLLLKNENELDERFDGIIYTVACLGGATSVIHVHNLPKITATSPIGSVLDSDAAPGLRDLVLLVGSPSFAADLGQGLTILLVAMLIGATFGILHFGGRSPITIAASCFAVGFGATSVELLSGGTWMVRLGLAIVACTLAFFVKRRSVFRNRPQVTENEVLIQGVKTVLMVLGATLVAAALFTAVSPVPDLPIPPVTTNSGPS